MFGLYVNDSSSGSNSGSKSTTFFSSHPNLPKLNFFLRSQQTCTTKEHRGIKRHLKLMAFCPGLTNFCSCTLNTSSVLLFEDTYSYLCLHRRQTDGRKLDLIYQEMWLTPNQHRRIFNVPGAYLSSVIDFFCWHCHQCDRKFSFRTNEPHYTFQGLSEYDIKIFI